MAMKRRAKRSSRRWISVLVNILFLCLGLAIAGAVILFEPSWIRSVTQVASSSSSSSSTSSSELESPVPNVNRTDWQLILVNRDNRHEAPAPELATIEDIQVDKRIEQDTKDFLAAARKIEAEEKILSAYRSKEDQTQIYNEAVAAEEAAGRPRSEAEAEVQKRIQIPGASEHKTGLAIDMAPEAGQPDELGEKIAAIAPDYGFVLRYPKDKSPITGVDFENWHYRYVGKESAKYMTKHNLVLEEYIALLKKMGR